MTPPTHTLVPVEIKGWVDRVNAIGLGIAKGEFAIEQVPEMLAGIHVHFEQIHPFLDGNGRSIMLVYAELARRAGFGIDWGSTDKDDYLNALTAELENPGQGTLDQYLKPFIRDGALGSVADAIKAAPGLDGNNADAVAGQHGRSGVESPVRSARTQAPARTGKLAATTPRERPEGRRLRQRTNWPTGRANARPMINAAQSGIPLEC